MKNTIETRKYNAKELSAGRISPWQFRRFVEFTNYTISVSTVENFQVKYKLTVDGRLGPITRAFWNKL